MLWSALRRRYRKADPEHIAELEQELGLAPSEDVGSTVRNGSTNFVQMLGGPTIIDLTPPGEGPQEPPKKKPERLVPVLDEDYFDAKRPRYYDSLSASVYGYGNPYGGASHMGLGTYVHRWP